MHSKFILVFNVEQETELAGQRCQRAIRQRRLGTINGTSNRTKVISSINKYLTKHVDVRPVLFLREDLKHLNYGTLNATTLRLSTLCSKELCNGAHFGDQYLGNLF